MRLIPGLLMVVLSGCSPGAQQDESAAAPVQPPAAVAAPALRAPPPPAEVSARAAEEPVTAVVVMEVMPLVNKSEDEVAALLGLPTACKDIHRARLCTYGPHEDEVLFVRGKADMITVQGMDAVAFNADALDALGLGRVAPDHADTHAIRWESIPGLVEVAVFPGAGGSVEYAYVKVGKH